MEFCPACRNMMLVKSSADGRAGEYRCPNCDNRKDLAAGTVLRATKPADDSAEYARFVTPLLSEDPALPRFADMACPQCGVVGEVLFVKYNAPHMRYLYHCGACKDFWKRGAGGAPLEKVAAGQGA